MKRQPTPDILGAILGGAAPVAPPSPAKARELLRTWQVGDAAEQSATLAAIQPPAPAGWAALSPTLARLAERLADYAGAGGTWLPEAECAAVFGTGAHGTQRNQLSALKNAGVIDYARGDGGWFVRLRTSSAGMHESCMGAQIVHGRTDGEGSPPEGQK